MAPLAPSKLKSTLKSKKMTSQANTTALDNVKSMTRSAVVTGPKRKAPAAPLEPESEEQSGEGEGDDEEAHIQGFSTDEDSSDDDGDEAPELPGIDLAKLPTVAKDDATVKRRLDQARKETVRDRGVLFLGQIPHGFYEDEMRAYFSQFGDVTRLRLSRNKKTGRSKHYGFIEFDSASVAQIVSETMDNYLLMGNILQCKVIPKEQVHPELWVGANRKWRTIPRDRVFRVQHNKPRTDEQRKRVERKLLKKQEDRQAKIRAAGIDYDIGAAGYRSTTVTK
ncbi:unnamed protein product [Rhizoctonia solani]|uniref:RRM domain-containing protein n=1 Tax=Rhizoctonia solani TaxID=456999 RepID=A0A8H2WFM1_9AGAM|nr:unnamed protein product [Rhizoctonia solani]CAE6500430.1 unnamed protein product [Rhizoctonia solani]